MALPGETAPTSAEGARFEGRIVYVANRYAFVRPDLPIRGASSSA
eukprot:CAMPEP_0185690326 /NCGR_PEP_ID=MMETSP1164-20130828/1046_1 /TAXON_ID=1104430 /ORGANISM="Chrysoreinhardia sp, Strain CCMP2950" /LENGTH=44 /DNA_ID= /DNA_START= /DNA_END= /DNA_ORIENTATION=